jgi:hypothetical protein
MIGGVVTSGVLELLLYPVIFVLWRRRHLPKETRGSLLVTEVALGPSAPPTTPRPPAESVQPRRLKNFLLGALIIVALVALVLGGYLGWEKFGHKRGIGGESGQPFATQKVNNLTVTFIHPKGALQNAMNEILIEFRDAASGDLVDVGTVKFDLDMNMPGMVMHNGATIEATGTPGQYRAKVKPDMAGDWMATLRYEGPRGTGSVSFPVNVKP